MAATVSAAEIAARPPPFVAGIPARTMRGAKKYTRAYGHPEHGDTATPPQAGRMTPSTSATGHVALGWTGGAVRPKPKDGIYGRIEVAVYRANPNIAYSQVEAGGGTDKDGGPQKQNAGAAATAPPPAGMTPDQIIAGFAAQTVTPEQMRGAISGGVVTSDHIRTAFNAGTFTDDAGRAAGCIGSIGSLQTANT
jgi:hypothetical protein